MKQECPSIFTLSRRTMINQSTIEVDSKPPIYLFVYGTLRKGMSRHEVLKNEEFIDNCYIGGDLYFYNNGQFPFVQMGTGIVFGEVYKISSTILARIDTIEGYYGEDEDNFFERDLINILIPKLQSPIDLYVYTYNTTKLPDSELIEDGDFVEFIAKKAQITK